MSFGIGEAVAAGLKIIDKFIPDPAARAEAEKQLRADLMRWDEMQTEVNKVEAANPNVFVAGWRPAIGWSCAAAFCFIYVLGPLITWATTLLGRPVPLPTFDAEALMTLTLGMLGLGGLRTLEKIKGATR